MKYVAILAVVVFLARADFFLGLYDKAASQLRNRPREVDVDGMQNKEVISLKDDTNLRSSDRDTLFALLENFQVTPTPDIRMKTIEILKAKPGLFSEKLDKDLEVRIFQWREHLNNNEPEVVNFILDLSNLLKGENKEVLRRFLALWMDINMENFLGAYVRMKDPSCTIVTLFGEQVPEEEVYNEYVERLDFITTFLAREKIDPIQKALATNCSLNLKLAIEKVAPPPASSEPETPQQGEGTTETEAPAAP